MKTTLGCCLGRQPCSVGIAEAGLPIPKAMTAGLCVFAADTVCQRRQGKAVSPQGAAPNLVSVPIRLPKASGLKCGQTLGGCYIGREIEHCQVLELWGNQNFPGSCPEHSSVV